ncbi:hypothetical protein [Loktanella salsilacus]|uniref:hypothetical protein n=1 Tax=Loktanella salsilacus TaxID=195913 RepID=UPI0030F788F1
MIHDAIEAAGSMYSGALLSEAVTLLQAGQSMIAPIMYDPLVWGSDFLSLVLP